MTSSPFAKRLSRMQRSTIREILKITTRKDIISFAGGLPAPELFPIRAFQRAIRQALTQDGAKALQYGITEGYPPLKELLCHWLTRQGLSCRPENMMLTNGSQQALDLLGKILLDPDDVILVENPTYLGAVQAFNAYEARYVTVPMDSEGLQLDALRKIRPTAKTKFVYVVPTFQNPSGITMSLERRRAFLKETRRRRLLIVEDDPYSWLRFSSSIVPSLYTLSKGKGVVYLSTFSKILSPGIRLGFVLAERNLIAKLVLAKQAADLQPNTLIQHAVYHYAKNGDLDKHIPVITEAYRRRAACMLAAMERYFPSEITWVKPEGGMFIWCRLPEGMSAARRSKQAIQNKVAFVTGAVFHANGGGDNTLRLNFTNSSESQIRDGIERLGKVFTKALLCFHSRGPGR